MILELTFEHARAYDKDARSHLSHRAYELKRTKTLRDHRLAIEVSELWNKR